MVLVLGVALSTLASLCENRIGIMSASLFLTSISSFTETKRHS